MKEPILSDAQKKRIESFAQIKKEFKYLISIKGSQKTAVIKQMAKLNKMSTATIYKAINK